MLGGGEREEEAGGVSPLGSFSASLLVLGLVCSEHHCRLLLSSLTPVLPSQAWLLWSGIKNTLESSSWSPVFRKISHKGLSIAVSVLLNTFLQTECPESFYNFKICSTTRERESEKLLVYVRSSPPGS